MSIVLWSVFFACKEPTAKRGEVGISDEELVFGDIPIGSIARQSMTLQNRSAKDISVLSVSLVSGNTGAWSVDRC